ncbi:MAG: response regulator transcription factor [Bacteroidota bacterium]
MEQPTILIVEDEEHIASLLETNLDLEGYQTVVAKDGNDARTMFAERVIHLIILDVMLPDTSGIDLCRHFKNEKRDIPILMLSALGQSKDRITGLKSGADDYLAKPFELQELLLRMSNLLERFQPETQVDDTIQLGKARIHFSSFEVIADDTSSKMTVKEAQLLKYMLERANDTVSRKDILEHVWGYDVYPNTRTIDNFIATFRKWIESDPSDPQIIKTVRGIGYRLMTS